MRPRTLRWFWRSRTGRFRHFLRSLPGLHCRQWPAVFASPLTQGGTCAWSGAGGSESLALLPAACLGPHASCHSERLLPPLLPFSWGPPPLVSRATASSLAFSGFLGACCVCLWVFAVGFAPSEGRPVGRPLMSVTCDRSFPKQPCCSAGNGPPRGAHTQQCEPAASKTAPVTHARMSGWQAYGAC